MWRDCETTISLPLLQNSLVDVFISLKNTREQVSISDCICVRGEEKKETEIRRNIFSFLFLSLPSHMLPVEYHFFYSIASFCSLLEKMLNLTPHATHEIANLFLILLLHLVHQSIQLLFVYLFFHFTSSREREHVATNY